jgi:hypothetical protein
MEARVGIEPTYKGFADLSLTTWVPRRMVKLAARPGICPRLGKAGTFRRSAVSATLRAPRTGDCWSAPGVSPLLLKTIDGN